MKSNFSQIRNRLESLIETVRVTALKTLEIEVKKSIQYNFDQQGRPQKWKRKVIDDGRAILTGRTARLQSQINVTRNDKNSISFGSNLPYSQIQQEGGTIPVTKKMKKYFWAMYYKTKNDKYKYLALSKKTSITIPARPYLTVPPSDFSRITKSVERKLNDVIRP